MTLRLVVLAVALASLCDCTMATIGGVDAGAVCAGPLSPGTGLYVCPPNWSDLIASPPQCNGGSSLESDRLGTCGPDLEYSANCGLHGFACFYDSVSRQLVGRIEWDDTPRFCDGSSSCTSNGVLPSGVQCRVDGAYDTCRPALGSADAGNATCQRSSDCPSGDLCYFDTTVCGNVGACRSAAMGCSTDASTDVMINACRCDPDGICRNSPPCDAGD